MERKIISLVTILILSIMAISCGQRFNPFGPDTNVEEQGEKAVLIGTIVLTGSNTNSLITGFGSIKIRIKGTNIEVNPDVNGYFQINNLPLGNIVVEVDVRNEISDILINNVQVNEEIRVRIEIRANNRAVLAHMERSKKLGEELQVEIRPDKWNTDWVNSDEEVTARIKGEGFDEIDTSVPLKMIGPEGAEIQAYTYEMGGCSFVAKFYQREAISIIPDPQPGDSHEIKVVGYFIDGSEFSLKDTIKIVGPKS